jgi:hypothetical protein
MNIRLLVAIKESVARSAAEARDDAGYGGRMDDGGASNMEERLKYWLDGIKFASTGNTEVYSSIAKRLDKETDPEYKDYKRLKEKFEKQ